MFAPQIDRSAALLRACRARGVPVFALSNFGAETFVMAQQRYPVLREFDRAYISAHLGVIKPDPAIYAAVEADCGLAPGSLLFVDDRPENIAAAEARGWRGHVFDGPEGWAAALVAHGVLSEEEARA
jgi:2-haloacid dehalogenase